MSFYSSLPWIVTGHILGWRGYQPESLLCPPSAWEPKIASGSSSRVCWVIDRNLVNVNSPHQITVAAALKCVSGMSWQTGSRETAVFPPQNNPGQRLTVSDHKEQLSANLGHWEQHY